MVIFFKKKNNNMRLSTADLVKTFRASSFSSFCLFERILSEIYFVIHLTFVNGI